MVAHPFIHRQPPAGTPRGSVRGWIVDPTTRREIVFESKLERGMAELLAASRDVSRVVDQPPAVSYVDPTRGTRRHTFDFLAITQSGTRIAIAVKPYTKSARSGIQDIIDQIRNQVGAAFADRFLLRTERHVTPDRVFNARLILRARSCRDQAAIEKVKNLLPAQGVVRICDVVAQSGLGAQAFNAIIGLIDDGRVQPLDNKRIDYPTAIRISSISQENQR